MPVCRTETMAPKQPGDNGAPRRSAPKARDNRPESSLASLLGPALQGTVDSLSSSLNIIAAETADVRRQLHELAQQAQERQRTDAIIADLHKRCTELNEDFHQRETLGPVFHCLVAIADRCRDKIRVLRRSIESYAKDSTLYDDVRGLIAARQADCIDVEQALAILGVRPFHHRHSRFDCQEQKVVRRVPTTDQTQVDTVAKRIQPGYRRDGRVIRPELVNVYTQAPSISKGE